MDNAVRQPATFVCTRDKTSKRRWETYISQMELYFMVIKATDADHKRACLLYCGGQDLSELFDTIKHKLVLRTNEDVAIDLYTATKTVLTEYFSSSESITYERSAFRALRQLESESATDFITRLRKKSTYCKFNEYSENAAIVDQFIENCTSNKLRVKLLSTQGIDLDKLIELSQATELAAQHAVDIVKHGQGVSGNVETPPVLDDQDVEHAWATNSRSSFSNLKGCYGCGSKTHIHGSSKCPATTKTCFSCGNVGHFSNVCLKSSRNTSRYQGDNKPNDYGYRNYYNNNTSFAPPSATGYNTNRTRSQPRTANFIDSDDLGPRVQSINVRDQSTPADQYIFYANDENVTNPKSRHKRRDILVDDKRVAFVIDSGTTTSIIDRTTYTDIFEGKVKLYPATVKIYNYGSSTPVPLTGIFYPTLQYNNRKTIAPVIVTDLDQAGCLLSESVSSILGILQMDQEIHLVTSDIDKIISTYKGVTKGIGKLKGYKMELDIDPTIKPTIQGLRSIPYHQLQLVDDEIQALLDADIIEPIDAPTTWCSPLHVVMKNDKIRLVVDLRKANSAIRRRLYPIPTLEDTLHKVKDSTFFSKIDLRKGYHQIELSENSRDITTFRYQNGIYRYKRLVFGLSSAFELFQHQITSLFSNLPGIENISDDIIVYGKTKEEHNRNLDRCLATLEENGLTINIDKCIFGVQQLEYYGFNISNKGIQPTVSKIEAVKSFKTPENSEEVRSFLGLINYLGRFIEHLASHTEPLRRLTVNDVPWRWTWGQTEQTCFDKLKDAVSSDKVMRHFKTHLPMKVITDASPVGLGAIFLQDQEHNNNYKPVCYISRSLSKVEQRYSQTEREALGVVWACEKLHLFLYGSKFIIETHHKPLIGLFGTDGNRSARIDRWYLRLLQYNYELNHIPGSSNPADALSRNPITSNAHLPSGYELEAEQNINNIIAHAVPKSLSLSQILDASEKSEEIKKVITCISYGHWERYPELKPYKYVASELTHKGGILLKSNTIVIPQQLRKTVLDIVHSTHQGINKTKSLLRSKVWWPGINQDTENLIHNCSLCAELLQPPSKPEPLTMPLPWEQLNVDLCRPMPSDEKEKEAFQQKVNETTKLDELDIPSLIELQPTTVQRSPPQPIPNQEFLNQDPENEDTQSDTETSKSSDLDLLEKERQAPDSLPHTAEPALPHSSKLDRKTSCDNVFKNSSAFGNTVTLSGRESKSVVGTRLIDLVRRK